MVYITFSLFYFIIFAGNISVCLVVLVCINVIFSLNDSFSLQSHCSEIEPLQKMGARLFQTF